MHAITEARILALADLGIRAAAIAAGGPSVALHVRNHAAGGGYLAGMTRKFLSLARPPEAAVLVNGHPDIARLLGAQGVQLTGNDLAPDDARRVFASGWIGCSVHGEEEAHTAARLGADFLMVGSIFPTASHSGHPAGGIQLVKQCARFGLPVIAIGGISATRVPELVAAGAYGVAAISALWDADDPALATLDMLRPWVDAA